MAARWERAELAKSRERGAADRWGVQECERDGAWLRFRFDHHRIYAPLEHPELPNAFSDVDKSDRELLSFVREFGRLGWWELRQGSEPTSGGWLTQAHEEHLGLISAAAEKDDTSAVYAEPVEWVRVHAATVRWCLEAGYALQKTGQERTRACRELALALPTPFGSRASLSASIPRQQTKDKVPAVDFVGGMLSDYLSINMRGVRRRVEHQGNGQLFTLWGGDSLIESIYTLVADSVTGGRLARCEACGAVFLQTHAKRKNCPPREGIQRSRCWNTVYTRKRRQLEKELLNGKKTRARRG